jgi:hypothetical protein
MIFVSHAREDREAAVKLVRELEAEGFDCLIDPDLLEGNPFWREELSQQFHECELMVCLASRHAEHSPWVEQERRAFPGLRMWIAVDPMTQNPRVSRGERDIVVEQGRALNEVRAILPARNRQCSRMHHQLDPRIRIAERLRHAQEHQKRLADFMISCADRSTPALNLAGGEVSIDVGSSYLQLKRAVHRKDTFVGIRSVTNAQYRAFVDATEYGEPPTWQRASFRVDDAPVTGVNWFEACAFAAWVGGALLTEDDWSQSARGRDAFRCFATESGELNHAEAYYDRPFGSGSPIDPMIFSPNPEGFYGLCGNSWDWCESPWGQHRVIRGGGYMDAAAFCRIQSRYRNAPIDRDCCVGFRVKMKCQ